MNNRTTKQAVACTKTATLRGKLTDGITMAKRLLVAVALAVAFFGSAYAQQQVAVLQRGDSVLGVYYGIDSFNQAEAASADGDIITLSGGNFNSPARSLSKAITIRGAGAMADTARGIIPTVFNEDFKCYSRNETTAYHLRIEGVMFAGGIKALCATGTQLLQSPEFIRCIFNEAPNTNTDCNVLNKNNAIYVNCILNECVSRDLGYNNCNFVNCVIWRGTDGNSTISLNNCLVRVRGYDGPYANNTIFIKQHSDTTEQRSLRNGTLSNCLIFLDTLINIQGLNNTVLPADSLSAVFATFRNSSDDINYSTSYALTSRAAASFLGIDGTQVGIYGGVMPFSFVPTYNVIRRCTVAPRSTADGKLSVDIELETEDGE